MIAELLPSAAVAVEMRGDCWPASLPASERALVEGAVARRRREFASGRVCARRAQERLGLAPVAILIGAHGEPLWPSEVVGSITHCAGYRACALAPTSEIAGIGIDAEPHAALPPGILESVASMGEIDRLRALHRHDPATFWDRLLFCAKEAAYKAIFPVVQRRLGFDAADITIDAHGGMFRADLAVGVSAARRSEALSGRWAVREGLILTAVAIPPGDHPLAENGSRSGHASQRDQLGPIARVSGPSRDRASGHGRREHRQEGR